ncbi:hypothetical protein B566_EDAN008773 [Ephemera danica]|nr:hypothetical protein B566_EDAN008773 [Ephemera danica]
MLLTTTRLLSRFSHNLFNPFQRSVAATSRVLYVTTLKNISRGMADLGVTGGDPPLTEQASTETPRDIAVLPISIGSQCSIEPDMPEDEMTILVSLHFPCSDPEDEQCSELSEMVVDKETTFI